MLRNFVISGGIYVCLLLSTLHIWTHFKKVNYFLKKPVKLCCKKEIFLKWNWKQTWYSSAAKHNIAISPNFFAKRLNYCYLNCFPGKAAEKHPHSMIPPPPCFTVGWCVCGDVQCLVSIKHRALSDGQKAQSWSHQSKGHALFTWRHTSYVLTWSIFSCWW